MLIRFTNSLGEINYGIVIGTDPSGLVHVWWDAFDQLLARLERIGRASASARRSLGVRKGWSRAPRTGPHGERSELLPIGTPVVWSCAELRAEQSRLIAGVAQ